MSSHMIFVCHTSKHCKQSMSNETQLIEETATQNLAGDCQNVHSISTEPITTEDLMDKMKTRSYRKESANQQIRLRLAASNSLRNLQIWRTQIKH